MLENIKSSYIIKKIFSYIDEGQKLKLVKYNLSLQKIMFISIINYKHFTRRYLIYESNGICKEYDIFNDMLLFEGEYLNGKRNGKGKEYNKFGSLIFNGEYLNGKRNGKGKEYKYGKLVFEGEYLNDKELIGIKYDNYGNVVDNLNHIKGKGKEYNFEGTLIFEGEYLNGEKNGKGKEYDEDGKLKFEGEYLNGAKWNGKGFNELNNIIYKIENGKGFIEEYYSDVGLIYESEYLNGKRNGKGKEYNWDGKLIFEGEYLNGQRNGKGNEYNKFNSKLEFEGDFLYNNKLKGKIYVKNKLEYEGEFL